MSKSSFFGYFGLAVVCLCIFSGCQKNCPGREYDTLRAFLSGPTKAHIDGELTLWDNADLVSIFYKSPDNEKWTVSEISGKGEAVLVRPRTLRVMSRDGIMAIVPYDATAYSTENQSITTSINTEQIWNEEGSSHCLLAAISQSGDLHFRYCNSFVSLHLKGDATISSIELISNAEEPLSGPLSLFLPLDGDPQVSCTGQSKVLLNCNTSIDEDGKYFIFSTAPSYLPDGLTFRIKLTNGTVQTVKVTTPVNLLCGHILHFEGICKTGQSDITIPDIN